MAYDYESFKKDIYKLTNINLTLYKERQMKRRIETLMNRVGFQNFEDYYKAIKNDPKLLRSFVSYLTINVSEFYRNPNQWEVFEKQMIPYLQGKFGTQLNIWSAACSTGDEPYSLVMALSKHMPLNRIRIYATDIDKQVMEKAKIGLYNEKSLAGVPKEFKQKYFEKVGPSYKIADEIKARVEFKQANLLKDTYPTNCDLIVCRNVLIYFTEEAKDEVFRKFAASLKKGGYLFIGSTEQIMHYKEMGYLRKSSFYYEKA